MRYNEMFELLQKQVLGDISQSKISKILDVSRSNINYKKEKNVQISDKDVKKIETYFNISLISDKSDCIDIPVKGDVRASMGYGITVYNENQTGIYQISKKLANDLGVNTKTTEMIVASGDSMLPTIEGGDTLLLDLSKKEIHDGRIYCVRIEGQLYAKRLQKIPPSKIIVISDNQKYQSFDIDFSKNIDFDFEVIGEVRWWGRIAR